MLAVLYLDLLLCILMALLLLMFVNNLFAFILICEITVVLRLVGVGIGCCVGRFINFVFT